MESVLEIGVPGKSAASDFGLGEEAPEGEGVQGEMRGSDCVKGSVGVVVMMTVPTSTSGAALLLPPLLLLLLLLLEAISGSTSDFGGLVAAELAVDTEPLPPRPPRPPLVFPRPPLFIIMFTPLGGGL